MAHAFSHPMPRRPAARGFTLIELMITVAILVILAAVATPSMTKLIATQRVKSAAGDLHMALLKTRSEAIKRNAAVTLKAATGGWGSGWTVVDPANPSGTPLLSHTSPSGVSVTTSVTDVVYNGTGRTTAGTGSFVFSASNTDLSRCVSIDASGRPYAKEGSSC